MNESWVKYRNDPAFHAVVDAMTRFISVPGITPYELREAAFFASVKYEMENVHKFVNIPANVDRAMNLIELFILENEEKQKAAPGHPPTGPSKPFQGPQGQPCLVHHTTRRDESGLWCCDCGYLLKE